MVKVIEEQLPRQLIEGKNDYFKASGISRFFEGIGKQRIQFCEMTAPKIFQKIPMNAMESTIFIERKKLMNFSENQLRNLAKNVCFFGGCRRYFYGAIIHHSSTLAIS